MTLTMQGRYGYTRRGVLGYFLNRFLRLYPTYWFVAAITLLMIAVFGEAVVSNYRGIIFLPRHIGEVAANLTLIFPSLSPKWTVPRLSPPAWALTLEILFYILIGLGASKTRRTTVLWFVASVLYTILTFVCDWGHEARYSYLPAASLPFSLGAILFHFKEESRAVVEKIPLSPFVLLCVYPVIAVSAGKAELLPLDVAFYLDLVLQVVIIAKLRDLPARRDRRVRDRRVGDLSYPVYLIHYQVGFLTSMIFWGEPIRELSGAGLAVGAVAVLFTVAAAYVICRLTHDNVEKLRSTVRSRFAAAVH